jgi:hypothetical protein
MKKGFILATLCGLLILMGGISCGSSPPPQEEPPASAESPPPSGEAASAPVQDHNLGPPDQAAQDALAAAKEQAEEARKRASDAGGPEYAAEEWEAAEALYTGAGEDEETDTLENVQESIARYEQAKAAYEDVYNLSLAQAKARQEQAAAQDALAAAKKQAEEARKRASDAGGPEYAAGEWKAAETLYTAAGKQEKTDTLENTRGSIARYEQAKAAYEDVYNRSQAQAKAQQERMRQERAAALDTLAAAKEQVEEARKRASDFGGPEYAAEEWAAAEALYTEAGGREKIDTLEDVRESIARYEQTNAAYEDVFNRSLPQYAQALQERILQERAAALAAGIGTLSPERLHAADDAVDRALGLYEAEDYSAAAGSGYLALDMFRLLKMGAETSTVRREIEDYGFEKYDPDAYDAAGADALAVIGGYDALPHNGGENIQEVLAQAEAVQARFNATLENGWKRYALERQAAAEAERQAALELKVQVAARDEFETAQASYDQAGTFFQADSYKEAAERYIQAEFLFAQASETASGKRRLAEEALREAEKKLADSDEMARKAEAILEGNNE